MTLFIKRTMMVAAAAGAALAVQSASVGAAEVIKMTAIDGYPAKALWVQEFSKFFIPEVDKRLAKTGKYKIQWKERYSKSLVKPKGVLDGIKKGIGDIGIVTTVFHSGKVPSQGIAFVTPFISVDARVVAKAVDEIGREFPQFNAEFDKQNQVYLATGVVLDSYQLFSTKPIKGIADLKGAKVAGAGYNMRYIEGLGAAGVRGGLTDFYNKLNNGTVNMAMLWPEAAMKFKINKVAPYMLKANLGSVNSKTVTVNKKKWNSLPDEVKDVLKEVAILYRDHVANMAMELAASKLAAFEKAGGTVIELSASERKAWADSMPNIAVEWARKLDAQGAPGSEMLKAYIGKLKAAGQKPVRDWGAELGS